MKIEKCTYLIGLLTRIVLIILIYVTLTYKSSANYVKNKRTVIYEPYFGLNYTLNYKAYDSFLEEYMNYNFGEYDLSLSAGILIINNLSISIEVRNSYIKPSLNTLDHQEKNYLLSILQNINSKKINTAQAEKILAINRLAFFLNLEKNFTITERMELVIGLGFGPTLVMDYYGFRKSPITEISKGTQIKSGFYYHMSDHYTVYTGYNYFKNMWLYKTNAIEDENGNITYYNFDAFNFSSHGISFGLIYKF